MKIEMNEYLKSFIKEQNDILDKENMQVPDALIDTSKIKIMMISEAVPNNPDDYFYSRVSGADYMSTTLPILQDAGINVSSIDDIIDYGIYITTAIKTPKNEYNVPTDVIKNQLSILEKEIDLFEELKVIMLMGDVAKKAVNMITKKSTGRNVIPSGATYKLRSNEYYYGNIRVLPSYIITGGNILIEKSKVYMIKEDLKTVQQIIMNN